MKCAYQTYNIMLHNAPRTQFSHFLFTEVGYPTCTARGAIYLQDSNIERSDFDHSTSCAAQLIKPAMERFLPSKEVL